MADGESRLEAGAMAEELELDAQVAAVPAARRFARRVVADRGIAADDVELVVAELVTNAVLHGAAPISVRILPTGSGLRVEVGDSGDLLPLGGLLRTDTMTGRGLGLVGALSAEWGVERRPGGGKVVWAEVAPTGGAGGQDRGWPADPADLSAWADLEAEEPAEQLFTVRLGSVPTGLLVEAKAHIDNVVRELTLAGSGAEGGGAGETGQTPDGGPVAELIDAVTGAFADARTEIKRQALAAARRGEALTDLVLRLPASALPAAKRYMDALDEADRYARAARLLTLAAPPAHQVFRRWYLSALVDQLSALAKGETPPRPPTFPEALAEEIAALWVVRDAWDRLQVLQKVTAELSEGSTVEDIVDIVVNSAVAHLGAVRARVYLLEGDGVLRPAAVATSAEHIAAAADEIPVGADLPGSVAFRSRQVLVLRSREEIEARFPALSGVYRSEEVLHVAPLAVGDHAIGILTIVYLHQSTVDESTQLSFVTALAGTVAQALERALATRQAAEANERLAFLAEVSVALAASLDPRATLVAVAEVMVPKLADWCIIHVVDGDELATAAVHHLDPAQLAWAQRLAADHQRRTFDGAGPAMVVRTGVSELYTDIDPDALAAATADEGTRAVMRTIGPTSAMVVPLTGRSGTFGAVTLLYAGSGRRYSPADVPFAEDVARRAALALEAARMFDEQSGQLAKVTRVADAAQLAILAPPPARIGPVALSARYLSAAAEARVGGDLYAVVNRPGAVRLLVGDVKGKGLTAVRTATVVLGEFRAAAADLEDLAAVAVQIDRRLGSYLEREDFVTAVLVEIEDDGCFAAVSCGHPAPLVAGGGQLRQLNVDPGLPLGLGASVAAGGTASGGGTVATRGRLRPGDRLLLYTDGLMEARDAAHEFIDLLGVARPVATAAFDDALDRLLEALDRAVGSEMDDDLALLLAEYGSGG